MNSKKNILQQKLRNHELPVDKSFWAEMEARLQRRKRSKIVPLWWTSGIAAAVAAFVLLFAPQSENDVQIADFKENKTHEHENNSLLDENADIFSHRDTDTQKNNIAKKDTSHLYTPAPVQKEDENQSITDTITKIDNASKVANIAEAANKTSDKQEVTELKPQKSLADYEREKGKRSGKKTARKQQTLALAMNFGYGSVASDFTEGRTNIPSRAPAFAGEANGIQTGLNNAIASESLKELLAEYPQSTYLPPLSVGLSVRKRVTEYFSVETGLIYTYLQTKFNDENKWLQQRATLQLHYLGVPLNAVYTLVNSRAWSLYASVGGTLEKGLWLDYEKITTYVLALDEDEQQHLAGKVAGLQWSASASVGAAVNLTKNFSIYFEPRIAYYFENEQPVSIRTDVPLHIGLNAGLRFSINN
ncbi:MAG: porin family protein [Prevotellaceae bacterium]|jgi:hypothetical protein|nr:porin family protein [Prevotellaceae bacterium]